MTKAKAAAYNAGVHAVLEMARRAATAIDATPGPHHVRNRAAIEALCALADNAQALLIEPRLDIVVSPNFSCDGGEPEDNGI